MNPAIVEMTANYLLVATYRTRDAKEPEGFHFIPLGSKVVSLSPQPNEDSNVVLKSSSGTNRETEFTHPVDEPISQVGNQKRR